VNGVTVRATPVIIIKARPAKNLVLKLHYAVPVKKLITLITFLEVLSETTNTGYDVFAFFVYAGLRVGLFVKFLTRCAKDVMFGDTLVTDKRLVTHDLKWNQSIQFS
jgi:hypothetical protein